MSAPLPEGVSHLLAADDALIPGRWGVHMTLCGQQVRAPSATAAEDPSATAAEDDCYPSFRYCSECVAQAAQDDASEPRGYFVGECGHRVPGGPAFYVGPCGECDPGAT